jgi:exonuclease SbcC
MKIKKIKLHNIRSYEEQEIEFPKGSILLSGDIGAGKTTILFSLEFALFGLQPGLVRGSTLLRHGADKGSVELEFELQGRSVIIKRGLERKKDSVSQSKGTIIIDGKEEELSPEELKARVLNLLGYPHDLLKKANFLYRFTLYTPQEEMKQILVEKADERLDVIRRIFDIEKYRDVINNSELIASKIRELIRANEMQTADLEKKQEAMKNKQEEKQQEQQRLEQLLPAWREAEKELQERKAKVEELAAKLRAFNKTKEAAAGFEAELKANKGQGEYHGQQIDLLQKEFEKLEKEFAAEKITELEKIGPEIAAAKKEEESLRQKMLLSEKELASLEHEKKTAKQLIDKIVSLEKCPTCEQQVSNEHKKRISDSSELKINSTDSLIAEKMCILKTMNSELEDLKMRQEQLRQRERALLEIKAKLSQLEEKRKLIAQHIQRKESLEEKITILNETLEKTRAEIQINASLESESEKALSALEELRARERRIAMEKVQRESQIKSFESQISVMEKEIKEKEGIALEITRLKRISSWLAEHFTLLISRIEKSIMLALNYEFNKMFEKWFAMLVDGTSVRIDESFSPIIEQQGYELEYNSLSGGERTAAALAYRLALNQTINSFMSRLATKSVLILDEPTDGFSSEQLDKMREVMQELSAEQLILVSHESKIENFVQNIIKFEKQGNISRISGNKI